MKRTASHWLALILLSALAMSAVGLASPAARPKHIPFDALTMGAAGLVTPTARPNDFPFDVSSTYGDRDKFDFKVAEGGCILAQIISWTRSGTSGSSASQLALILNGSDRTGYYARVDGSSSSISPLWLSYAVSSSDVNRVKTWTISVVNFTRSGTAKGTINLEYPPTQVPCELKAAISHTKGAIDLGWRYTETSFKGSFLVERSTNGRTWSVVSACKKSRTSSTSYSCSDTGLKSGTTYYYRACAITSGSKCETKNVTPPTRITAT